jgi:hypothetical protein
LKKLLLRAGIVSVVALAALFLYKLSVDANRHYYHAAVSYDGFEISRKNYASFKKGGSAPQSLGNTQKYEKLATLRETTRSFDDTRKKVNALISDWSSTNSSRGLPGAVFFNLASAYLR